MTSDLIDKLAKEAGLVVYELDEFVSRARRERRHRFAALVAEECARICDGMGDGPHGVGWDSEDYAAAIRTAFKATP